MTAVAVCTWKVSVCTFLIGLITPAQNRPSSRLKRARMPLSLLSCSSGSSTSLACPMRNTRFSLMVISTRAPKPVRIVSPAFTLSPRCSTTNLSVPLRFTSTGRTRYVTSAAISSEGTSSSTATMRTPRSARTEGACEPGHRPGTSLGEIARAFIK